jgi:hypothetical protein
MFFGLFPVVFGGGSLVHAEDTYTSDEIFGEATQFFGSTTEGLASIIEKAFADKGRPNGFIVGEEMSGALFVGLRYGHGELSRKTSDPLPVFWRGPSIGWDFGGNASKVFTLVYNMPDDEAIFQRYPGVDGSIYLAAGLGMNYQQLGDVVLAQIRTGIGLRAGANIGYLHYTRKEGWLPF